MLDIKYVREHTQEVRKNLEKRKNKEILDWFDDLVKKDEEYRKLLQDEQSLRKRRNEVTDEIRQLKKEGKDASRAMQEAKDIPGKVKEAQEKTVKIKEEVDRYLMHIPNMLHESVPYGKDSSENKVMKEEGKKKKFDFKLKPHGEIAESLGMANFDDAGKNSGHGFYYLLGDLARTELALQRLALDILIEKGFTLVEPPLMLRREPYEGVTDLADFETMMYKIENEDLYLIATSEHPIAAMLKDKTMNEKELPKKYAGISPCFRKELGSHGVDERGFFRVHHFNKVEMFIFCRQEDSWKMHEELLSIAESIFKKLELPYRVVNICTGDIGIVAAKKYDIEAFMPREEEYKEVVSCSNCTAYQANRLNIRYQKGAEKMPVHTLNSTAIATSRALRAILENYQNKDGTVDIPKVLQPYMNGLKRLEKMRMH